MSHLENAKRKIVSKKNNICLTPTLLRQKTHDFWMILNTDRNNCILFINLVMIKEILIL
jgi:hypothetical protein